MCKTVCATDATLQNSFFFCVCFAFMSLHAVLACVTCQVQRRSLTSSVRQSGHQSGPGPAVRSFARRNHDTLLTRQERRDATPNTTQHSRGRDGRARHSPARHGTTRHGTARHCSARHCSARHCIAWRGIARHGIARHGIARHGLMFSFLRPPVPNSTPPRLASPRHDTIRGGHAPSSAALRQERTNEQATSKRTNVPRDDWRLKTD